MIYHVRARLKDRHAAALLEKLTNGSIARQRPDGSEIVASMHRAVVTDGGLVEWSEMCFCPSPLQHERTTVLDHHFEDIVTEPIGGHEVYQGRPFMDHLRDSAARGGDTAGTASDW